MNHCLFLSSKKNIFCLYFLFLFPFSLVSHRHLPLVAHAACFEPFYAFPFPYCGFMLLQSLCVYTL
ncbi:hypothetical protein F5887DRAFT_951316, partial [Amanita rubescens]